MRNFWAYVTNGQYSVGCTGRTVFIYDKDDNEIAKFKDITYGYTPMFSPDGKIVVVKTPEGRFAVYSLETLSLIKKFRFSKVDGAQDDGFCFSHDSKYLVNLERHQDSLHSKKKYQWSFFDCSLEELKSMKCSLAELYKRYNL